jgi:hypothetical protein
MGIEKKQCTEQGLCVKDAEGGNEGAGAEAFGRGTDTLQQPGRAVEQSESRE